MLQMTYCNNSTTIIYTPAERKKKQTFTFGASLVIWKAVEAKLRILQAWVSILAWVELCHYTSEEHFSHAMETPSDVVQVKHEYWTDPEIYIVLPRVLQHPYSECNNPWVCFVFYNEPEPHTMTTMRTFLLSSDPFFTWCASSSIYCWSVFPTFRKSCQMTGCSTLY